MTLIVTLESLDKFQHNGIKVPRHLHYGIERYVNHHQKAGHFLTAVVENDLSRAIACADEHSLHALPAVVAWLYNEAPSGCWGSKKKVKEWLRSIQS